MKTSWIIILSMIFCFPIVVNAFNCAPLDPRGKITKEEETVIAGKVAGVFKKLLDVGGEFQRKIKETVDNLHGQLPKAESQIIKEKVIYLYCEALNEAKMEQKITLLSALQNTLGLPTGASEDLEASHGVIRAIGYASITWQCKEDPCPPRAELKRRAIRVAEITAATALGRQLKTGIKAGTIIVKGQLTEERIEEEINILLRGIRYDSPEEKDDEISIRARLAFPSN